MIPAAVTLWAEIRGLQAQGESVPRALLDELARAVGYDHLRIEPHRVPSDGRQWGWLYDREGIERFEQAKTIKAALDAALAAATAEAAPKADSLVSKAK